MLCIGMAKENIPIKPGLNAGFFMEMSLRLCVRWTFSLATPVQHFKIDTNLLRINYLLFLYIYKMYLYFVIGVLDLEYTLS